MIQEQESNIEALILHVVVEDDLDVEDEDVDMSESLVDWDSDVLDVDAFDPIVVVADVYGHAVVVVSSDIVEDGIVEQVVIEC